MFITKMTPKSFLDNTQEVTALNYFEKGGELKSLAEYVECLIEQNRINEERRPLYQRRLQECIEYVKAASGEKTSYIARLIFGSDHIHLKKTHSLCNLLKVKGFSKNSLNFIFLPGRPLQGIIDILNTQIIPSLKGNLPKTEMFLNKCSEIHDKLYTAICAEESYESRSMMGIGRSAINTLLGHESVLEKAHACLYEMTCIKVQLKFAVTIENGVLELEKGRRLSSLDLRNAIWLTDEKLMKLLPKGAFIKKILLQGCSQLSEVGIRKALFKLAECHSCQDIKGRIWKVRNPQKGKKLVSALEESKRSVQKVAASKGHGSQKKTPPKLSYLAVQEESEDELSRLQKSPHDECKESDPDPICVGSELSGALYLESSYEEFEVPRPIEESEYEIDDSVFLIETVALMCERIKSGTMNTLSRVTDVYTGPRFITSMFKNIQRRISSIF